MDEHYLTVLTSLQMILRIAEINQIKIYGKAYNEIYARHKYLHLYH